MLYWLVLPLFLVRQAAEPASQDIVKEALQDFQSGDDTSARALLNTLLAKEPDNAPAHNLLGLILMKQKQFPEAKQEFEASARLQPQSAASHTNLGNALVQLHRDKDAEQEFRRALALRPQDEPALENLGLLEARAGRYSEAAESLTEAHTLKPHNATVSAALAASLISLRNFSAAESLLPELQNVAEPVTASSRYSLGLLALESGAPELGLKLVAGDPPQQTAFLTAAFERAASLSASRNYPEALSILTPFVQLQPERADLHDLLGTVYYELDKPQQSIDELQTAIRLEPGDADHYYKLGMIFLKHRTPEGAIYVFETAVKQIPQDHRLWLGLGLSNYVKGDLVQSKTDLYHALSLKPGDASTYTVLCDLLTQSHADDELLRVIDDAVKAAPDNYLLPYYYGRVLEGTDTKRAIFELQESIGLNGRFARAHYELGKLLAKTANTSAAINALEKSIALNPNLLEAHLQLGELYRRNGRQALADAQFAAVRRIRADGSSEETVQRLLFTIEK